MTTPTSASARAADGTASASIADVVRDGAVTSVFQPIVELDTGAVVAYEALARGPEGPLASPAALFDAAREAGCWPSSTRRAGPPPSAGRARRACWRR